MWELKLCDQRPLDRPPRVGEIWPMPELVTGKQNRDIFLGGGVLSRQYRAEGLGKRAPLVVRLPDGTDYLLDAAHRGPGGVVDGNGPAVKGIPPQITLDQAIQSSSGQRWVINEGVLVSEAEFEQGKRNAAKAESAKTTTEAVSAKEGPAPTRSSGHAAPGVTEYREDSPQAEPRAKKKTST